jgi:hypothetical protein
MGKKKSRSGSGIQIRDEHARSYFRELRNNFLGVKKYFFYAEPDPGSRNLVEPGSGMEKNTVPG